MPKLHITRTTRPPLLATALLALVVACGDIEPEPPVDEEGQPIALPEPYDDFLVVLDVTPEGDRLAPRPRIIITMSDYLDDDSFFPFSVVSLASGGIRARGLTDYRMTYRQLIFEPYAPLTEGLRYELEILDDTLTSATNAPFLGTEATRQRWIVDDDVEPVPPVEEEVEADWQAVRALFAARCDGCHSDRQWQLVPLTHQALVNQKSRQTQRYLVRPFDPADSYLMHKILPDYPDRRFTVQPPPWHEGSELLSREEIWLVERWIRAGARSR